MTRLEPDAGGAWGTRDVVILVAAGIAATLFHLLYFNHGVRNWIDLGVAAADAERVLRGEVYGRDFAAPYGPGRYYLTAFWFALFGTSLLALNMLYVALMTGANMLAYALGRRFLPRGLALVAALFSIAAHGPVHKVWIALFSSLFLVAACRALERRTFTAGAFMGAAGAAAGLFREDLGGLALLCALLALLAAASPLLPDGRERGVRRLAAGVVAGGLAIAAPAGAALLVWADPGWIIASIIQRIRVFDWVRIEEMGTFPGLAPGDPGAILERVLTACLLAAPFAAAAAGAFEAFVRRNGARGLRLLLLGLTGIFLLNQWRLIPKFVRLLEAGPVLHVSLVLLAAWAGRFVAALARSPRAAPIAAGAAVAVAAGAMGWYLWAYTGLQSQDSIAVLRFDETFMDRERAQVFARTQRAEDMLAVVRRVSATTAEDEAIFAGPAVPIVPFLADRRNGSPFSDPFLYYFDPEAEQRIIDSLERAQVRLYVDQPRPIGGIAFPDAAPKLFAYLVQNFPRREQIGRFEIWRR